MLNKLIKEQEKLMIEVRDECKNRLYSCPKINKNALDIVTKEVV